LNYVLRFRTDAGKAEITADHALKADAGRPGAGAGRVCWQRLFPYPWDGAVVLAGWPRGAFSVLAWAMTGWAASAAGFLLGQQLLGGTVDPQRLAVLAATVLAVALVGCLTAGAGFPRALAGIPFASRATALRDKSWHVAFLRQRDPDAAGRPRPRAPGVAPAAA
jgi:hypothetical protein